MKKTMRNILALTMIILLIASSTTIAEEINLITDDAYLLTDEEYWKLNDRAEKISEKHKCDLAIITVDEMEGSDAYEYAKHLLAEYEMGYGDEKSILLLFLSMEDRDYALVAHGYGNTAFTDHGKDVMLDKHMLPLLGKDKYYESFSKYLDIGEEYLEMARAGTPFDISTDPDHGKLALPIKLGITFLLPVIIAFVVCQYWKSKMKTAVLARTAGDYITAEGLKLTNQQDLFLYRTETRRRIESKSSGGTTKDRSGSSGRSGKF